MQILFTAYFVLILQPLLEFIQSGKNVWKSHLVLQPLEENQHLSLTSLSTHRGSNCVVRGAAGPDKCPQSDPALSEQC